MRVHHRLLRARTTIVTGLSATAVLWGASACVAVLLAAVALDYVVELPRDVRRAVLPLAIAVGILVAAVSLWRARRARTLRATALWIEERVPALQYALVSSLEPDVAPVAPLLARQVENAGWDGALVARAVGRRVLLPLTLLGLAIALLVVLPEGSVARVRSPSPGDALRRPANARGPSGSRLGTLVVRVIPPAYSERPARTIDDPATVDALEGSRIDVMGRGSPDGLLATREAVSLSVHAHEAGWRVALVMPSRPSALRLTDGSEDRLLVLDAQRDSAPVVSLTAPARDTILREPTGTIQLRGEARDALGLASAWTEFIVSSGQGESFRFRSGVLSRRSLEGARSASLATAISIDSMRLSPGDVVHLRFVARDRNPAADAGTGASETRVVRIARAGEYDSVAVDGAPPPDADTSAISQRMLILLTEALVKREPRLARDTVVRESRSIALEQTRLRRRVGEIIFSRLTGEEGAEHSHDEAVERRGQMTAEELLEAAEEATSHGAGEVLDFAEGESPVVAINRPLLDAYNAMWAAAGELNIGAPGRALPHMYEALAAIERARQAERVYLRGRPAPVVVDVNRARLAGQRDSLPPAVRRPQRDTTSAPTARFARAVRILPTDRASAVDSLLLLRVEMLADSPRAAAALGEAIRALREGQRATAPLARAREALAGPVHAERGLSTWGAFP